jgi:arabinogalactan endo-1,4-beta-galactosidase
LTDQAKHYNKYVLVAEYSQYIEEVNDIAFTARGNKAVGSFIWEPLGKIFDRQGKPTIYLSAFSVIAHKYVSK